MKTSDVIALFALVIASGALALEVKRWFESGPKLVLSVDPDGPVIDDTPFDQDERLILMVTNRGSVPTRLIWMFATGHVPIWKRLLRRADEGAVVFEPVANKSLDVNQTFQRQLIYNEATSALRANGELHVGVIASHRDRPYLIRVPKKVERRITRSARA